MYKSKRPQPARPAPHRQGFALLITIVLMAFLVLIMVSFASLTRVEIQIASNYQQQDAARQNALTALQIALGQLQAAAGPDQRITARAEILDDTPATSPLTGVTQPHWTGVWTTGNANPDVTNSSTEPKQREITFGSLTPTLTEKASNATAWLVSNPLPSTPVNPLTATFTVSDTFTGADLIAAGQSGVTQVAAGGTPTAVVLAKNIGRQDPASPRHDTAADSSNAGYIVAAPLVGLTAPSGSVPGLGAAATPTIGRYAYWVSDEGVKAKVNIKDPTLKTDATGTTQVDAIANLAQNLLHFATPQANAAHKIWTDTNTGNAINTLASDFRMAADFRQNPKVDQVLTPQSIPLLPSSAPTGYVSNRYLADVTTYSYGVLADVRNGGLRKDLTAALEDTGGTPNKNYAVMANQRVYNIFDDAIPKATETSTTGFAPGGGIGVIDNTNRGLTWNSLHLYYNHYKFNQPRLSATVYGSSQLQPTGVNDPRADNRPYSISALISSQDSLNQNTQFNNYATGQLTPICISMRWDVALESRVQPDGKYKLFLKYYPLSVWYNPYTVKITSTTAYLNMIFSPLKDAYLKILANGETSYCMLNQADSANQRIIYTNTQADSATFEPGEIRVFGLNTPQNLIATTSTKSFATQNNIQYASGFYVTGANTELKATNFDPQHFTHTEYTGVSLEANRKSATATGIHTPLTNNLTGSTSITITLKKRNSTAIQALSIPPFSSIYWPAKPEVNRTTAGYLPSATNLGTPLPTSIDVSRTFSISQLTTPQLLITFNTRKKGLRSFNTLSYSNSSFDIPSFMGNSDAFNPINAAYSQSWNEYQIPDFSIWPTNYSTPDSLSYSNSASGNYKTTTWGSESTGAETSPGQNPRKVLAEIPLQPMLSLGQFMHLQTWQQVYINHYQQLGFGSMFVGGSCPNPSVPLNSTLKDVPDVTMGLVTGGQRLYTVDHSFLVNQKLFDSYYFSTVPPASLPTSPASPTNWTQFNNQNTGTQLTNTSTPFLNSRMVPYRKNGNAPALAELRDMDRAAANLLINGAFNINSTSVDAWRTLLSSLSGNDLNLWNASTRMPVQFAAADLKNPIPRFWSATGNSNLNEAWCGVRALSDTEVTELAKRIVVEVKTRGPFLSLSDFLNRRLGDTGTALTRAGTLQAAIDKTDINLVIKNSGTAVNVAAALNGTTNRPLPEPIIENMKDATGTTWNTTVGMPGYLMQQDLVQAFSPVMAARSDTFVIRTYGEKTDPLTDKPIAKAYCEAVVQRVPDYIDPTDTALTALGDATPLTSALNSTNQTFGRRFKVISFRWLSPHDL